MLSGVLIDLLSPSEGIVNAIITFFGGKPVYFLGDDRYFPATMVVTDVWKNFGFNTVVYLAAITGIDPVLYESCLLYTSSGDLLYEEPCAFEAGDAQTRTFAIELSWLDDNEAATARLSACQLFVTGAPHTEG